MNSGQKRGRGQITIPDGTVLACKQDDIG